MAQSHLQVSQAARLQALAGEMVALQEMVRNLIVAEIISKVAVVVLAVILALAVREETQAMGLPALAAAVVVVLMDYLPPAVALVAAISVAVAVAVLAYWGKAQMGLAVVFNRGVKAAHPATMDAVRSREPIVLL